MGQYFCIIKREACRMAHLIAFRTDRFNISQEPSNPINPIAGHSVLNWLREELAKAAYQSTEPDTEDWGWYIEVEGESGAYLVGASADAEGTTSEVDWMVQVHKRRSLKEKLLGRNRMAADDPLFALIERLVRADKRMAQVSVERDA
jgi:hypothetical protein